MIVCHGVKAVFITTGKAGSASIFRTLEGHYGGAVHGTGSGPTSGYHGIDRNILLNEWKNYFVFASVRNPYTRMLSLYKFIQRKTTNYMHKYAVNKSFPRFVEWHCGPTDPEVERVPCQAEYLRGVRIDRVIKFETLQEEWDRLPFVTKKIMLPFKHKTQYEKPWRAYYDADTIARVNKWAAEDFTKFGYQREGKNEHSVGVVRKASPRPDPVVPSTPQGLRPDSGDPEKRDDGGDAASTPHAQVRSRSTFIPSRTDSDIRVEDEKTSGGEPEEDSRRGRHSWKRQRDESSGGSSEASGDDDTED